MNNKQEAFEKMSLSGVNFLTSNAAITSTLTGFSTYFSNIQTIHPQIAAAKLLQEYDITGVTTVKHESRSVLIVLTIDTVSRLVAYAVNKDDAVLKAKINYTESDLNKSSDTKLVSCCQIIHDEANANLTALATYKVTAATIAALQTAITAFSTSIPKGRINKTGSAGVTKNLAQLFAELNKNWKKIDILMKMVQASQPKFYAEYQDVRKVIVLGKGALSMKIQTVNADTGKPEPSVTLQVTPVNVDAKVAATKNKLFKTKKTFKGGGSNYKNLPDGSYTVTAKKVGFKDESIIINIVNGETVKLKFKMKKV